MSTSKPSHPERRDGFATRSSPTVEGPLFARAKVDASRRSHDALNSVEKIPSITAARSPRSLARYCWNRLFHAGFAEEFRRFLGRGGIDVKTRAPLESRRLGQLG